MQNKYLNIEKSLLVQSIKQSVKNDRVVNVYTVCISLLPIRPMVPQLRKWLFRAFFVKNYYFNILRCRR